MPVWSKRQSIGEQRDLWQGAPVPFGQALEARPLVEPVSALHPRRRVEHESPLLSRPGPIYAGVEEPAADAAPLGAGKHRQHPDAGLFLLEQLCPGRAGVRDEGDTAEDAALVLDCHEHLSFSGSSFDRHQLSRVVVPRLATRKGSVGRQDDSAGLFELLGANRSCLHLPNDRAGLRGSEESGGPETTPELKRGQAPARGCQRPPSPALCRPPSPQWAGGPRSSLAVVCDTLVSFSDEGVLFAKNSDREPNEAQVVEFIPAARHEAGAALACTHIEIPQAPRTNAIVISRPWWMWGAEMGANEHGVVIGNEAVWTRRRPAERALLGMDLLRLGLERASTAERAVSVIVELLERHGQGGACSHSRPGLSYDNSFLLADPSGAFVLETAGRQHATERVRARGRSISNELTIPGFKRAHSDWLHGLVASAGRRRQLTEEAACVAEGPADLISALRQHGPAGSPSWSLVNGALAGPCVHAGGLLASSQTAGSWVADLRSEPLHFVTATAAPCTSLFKPLRVGEALFSEPAARNHFDEEIYWWRHELLHRATLRDHAGLLARYRPARDLLERSFIEEPPPALEAFKRAEAMERSWLAEVVSSGVGEARPAWLRRYWQKIDRRAGLREGLAA